MIQPYLSLKITEFLTRTSNLRQQLLSTRPSEDYLSIQSVLENTLDGVIEKIKPFSLLQEMITGLEDIVSDRIADATTILNDVCFYYGRYYFSVSIPERHRASVRLMAKIIETIPPLYGQLKGKILVDLDESFATWLPRKSLTEPIATVVLPSTESFSLLSLPLAAHEAGHFLVHFEPKLFDPFRQHLERFTSRRLRQVRGQSANAIQRERQYLKLLTDFWANWMIEIACDVTGLHIFGAYFLRAMEQVFIGGGNPFQPSPTHPPHHLRMETMLDVLAKNPEWADEISSIRSDWADLTHRYTRAPDYDLFCIPEVLQACVDNILSGFQELNLPWYIPPSDLQDRFEADEELSVADAVAIVWREFLTTSSIPLELEKRLIEKLTRVRLD